MQRHEIEESFRQQAASYDRQWENLAHLRDGLHFLIAAVFADLPDDARILCVGAGTGAEISYLAQRFPHWHFTAVDPSVAMLDACRRRAEEHGIRARLSFHEGYLDSLPPSEPCDAATCLLVSQFILDETERSGFFRSIAERLRPGGLLASADLAADIHSAGYHDLLEVWLRMMTAAEVAPEMLERVRGIYARDVGVLPPGRVGDIIATGGFEAPIPFFQGGLMHAWYARKATI